MTSAIHKDQSEPPSKFQRVLQVIGAVIVTAFVLYLLFGVPAYVLFGVFFD